MRLYNQKRRKFAFRADYPGGFQQWQADAGPSLKNLIGLNSIAASIGDHVPKVELGDIRDVEQHTLREGSIETEPDVRIPFWLLKPKGRGPYPLAVLPHGHDRIGHDTYAGVYRLEHFQEIYSRYWLVGSRFLQTEFRSSRPRDRAICFEGRLRYDPIAPRDGFVVTGENGPPWKNELTYSNEFEYEVVEASAQ